MINCTSFDYINLLTKAADASWKRETVISNNIANVNTPGYKRKDLNFQGVLTEELGRCKHESLDSKVSDVDLSDLIHRYMWIRQIIHTAWMAIM